MPKLSNQKSVISNQDLRTRPIRRFLSNPRPAGRPPAARAGTGRLLIPVPRGFTLIELLVVIAVIGVLSTVILANYNSFGARQEVKNAAEELKSELRKYQTYAISGQKNPTQVAVGSGCNDPARTLESYSVEIDDSVSPPTIEVKINCGVSVVLEDNFPWSDRVELAQIGRYDESVVPPFSSCTPVKISFLPINEGVSLECSGSPVPSGESLYISVTNSDGSTIYNVFVTETGGIYVERQP